MRRVIGLAGLLALLAVSCSARTPLTAGSPTASPSPSAGTASPSPSPVRVPRARMAVYVSEGSLWLYEAVPDRVSELARGEGMRLPKWVSTSAVSFVQDRTDGSATLRSFDLRTQEVSEVLEVASGIDAYDWSPDRQLVAYITTDAQSYPHLNFQEVVGGGATMPVATLGRALGRELTPFDERSIEFSPDGSRVLVVYTPADGESGRTPTEDESPVQVRGIDGVRQFAIGPDREPSMAVWSADGARVYYRDSKGTHAWVAATGRTERAPGNPAWFNPTASRDGKWIAYDTGATTTSVTVRMVDLGTGNRTRLSGQGWFHPVTANERTVWAQRAQPCSPDCLQPVVPGPEVVSIDTRTLKMRKLAIPTLVEADFLYS